MLEHGEGGEVVAASKAEPGNPTRTTGPAAESATNDSIGEDADGLKRDSGAPSLRTPPLVLVPEDDSGITLTHKLREDVGRTVLGVWQRLPEDVRQQVLKVADGGTRIMLPCSIPTAHEIAAAFARAAVGWAMAGERETECAAAALAEAWGFPDPRMPYVDPDSPPATCFSLEYRPASDAMKEAAAECIRSAWPRIPERHRMTILWNLKGAPLEVSPYTVGRLGPEDAPALLLPDVVRALAYAFLRGVVFDQDALDGDEWVVEVGKLGEAVGIAWGFGVELAGSYPAHTWYTPDSEPGRYPDQLLRYELGTIWREVPRFMLEADRRDCA